MVGVQGAGHPPRYGGVGTGGHSCGSASFWRPPRFRPRRPLGPSHQPLPTSSIFPARSLALIVLRPSVLAAGSTRKDCATGVSAGHGSLGRARARGRRGRLLSAPSDAGNCRAAGGSREPTPRCSAQDPGAPGPRARLARCLPAPGIRRPLCRGPRDRGASERDRDSGPQARGRQQARAPAGGVHRGRRHRWPRPGGGAAQEGGQGAAGGGARCATSRAAPRAARCCEAGGAT